MFSPNRFIMQAAKEGAQRCVRHFARSSPTASSIQMATQNNTKEFNRDREFLNNVHRNTRIIKSVGSLGLNTKYSSTDSLNLMPVTKAIRKRICPLSQIVNKFHAKIVADLEEERAKRNATLKPAGAAKKPLARNDVERATMMAQPPNAQWRDERRQRHVPKKAASCLDVSNSLPMHFVKPADQPKLNDRIIVNKYHQPNVPAQKIRDNTRDMVCKAPQERFEVGKLLAPIKRVAANRAPELRKRTITKPEPKKLNPTPKLSVKKVELGTVPELKKLPVTKTEPKKLKLGSKVMTKKIERVPVPKYKPKIWRP